MNSLIIGQSCISYRVAVSKAKYGQLSYGRIWADSLGCTGGETDVFMCKNALATWRHASSCDHSMDAGVVCGNTMQVQKR